MTPQSFSAHTPSSYRATTPAVTIRRARSARAAGAHRNNKVLGVTIEGNGAVRWGCNHCGWTGPHKGNGGHREELKAYVYRDRTGAVRFRKVRNRPDRTPRFWLERPDGSGGWVKGAGGIDTGIIYRADEIAAAITAGKIIAVVEGEKDADNLWSIGMAATCNAHGASEPAKKPKWTREHSAQLADADIVVLGDNDAAGMSTPTPHASSRSVSPGACAAWIWRRIGRRSRRAAMFRTGSIRSTRATSSRRCSLSRLTMFLRRNPAPGVKPALRCLTTCAHFYRASSRILASTQSSRTSCGSPTRT
jgi:hypothetical protein